MRIAFVVNNYPPRVGGVENHVYALATHLRSFGCEVLVVTLSDMPGLADEDGITVARLAEHARVGDVLGFPPIGTKRRLVRLLRKRRVDVVSVHTRFFPMSWIGLRAGRRAGAVVIHTEHGSDHVVSSSVLIAMASRLVDHTLGRYVLRRADVVLGVSEKVTAFVERLSGRRAGIFYNAIDPDPNDTIAPPVERLVFVGRLVPGKGTDVFLDVTERLASRWPGLDAVIVGDGPERTSIAERIARTGIGSRVRLLGRVSPDEVRRELRGAVLVNPTTLSEGFQTTLLEALDVHGRVATFDVPGARLLQEQGHPVRIADARTADELTLQVESLLKEPGGAPSLQNWYWTERAREYARLAEETLQRQGSGAPR